MEAPLARQIEFDQIEAGLAVGNGESEIVVDPFVRPGGAHGQAQRVGAGGGQIVNRDLRCQALEIDGGVIAVAGEALAQQPAAGAAQLDHAFTDAIGAAHGASLRRMAWISSGSASSGVLWA